MPSTPGGGVTLSFEPPLQFIQAQQGLFRHLLEDLTSLWARFIPLIAEMERRWFDSQGESAWPALAETTLERKRAEGFSGLPLRTDDRQGSLYDTLIDPNLAAEPFGDQLVWSTGVPYAHWHQDGGAVAGRPPQRQVIPDPLPVAYRRQFEQATVSWLNEQAAIAFGRT